MQLLIPPVSVVESFLARSGAGDATDSRLTTHCMLVPCEKGTLLYHTLTGALVLLEGDETPDSEKTALARLHFYVANFFDENRYARQLQQMLALAQSAGAPVTSYTIFTTTDCNARCFYCYEKGIRRFTMTEATATDVAAYIIRSCGEKKVTLNWFGGEPLLNKRAIALICRRLSEAGVAYKSTIITNGYLFDQVTVAEARQLWRLKSAHITLDGTREVYLRTKAYVNGDSAAFERVLDNIYNLLEHQIAVQVRLNLNRDNDGDILRLCEELGARFAGKRGFSAAVVLLRQYEGDARLFPSQELAVSRLLAVRERLQSLGMLFVAPLETKFRCFACIADSDNAMAVYPDGTLGKCEHFSESEIIGSIYDDKRDGERVRSWKKRKADTPLCSDCPLYPQCFRLEKCPNLHNDCTELIRQLRIRNMTERILKTYREKTE